MGEKETAPTCQYGYSVWTFHPDQHQNKPVAAAVVVTVAAAAAPAAVVAADVAADVALVAHHKSCLWHWQALSCTQQ